MSRILLTFALVIPSLTLAGIRHFPEAKTWVLETEGTSYVLRADSENRLLHLYWGARLQEQDYRAASFQAAGEEYPAWGGRINVEPCLKVNRPDGVRDLVLRYASHEQTGDTLILRLKDIRDDISVELEYQVYESYDIIRKSARITNGTGGQVTLESVQSGLWQIPAAEQDRLTYLAGHWGREFQVLREQIHQGAKVLESRIGKTGHYLNPWFAVDHGDATEETGAVWFGALAWSGNWKFTVERTSDGRTWLTGGYNDFDFAWPLHPGESFETPAFYGGFTSGGFGDASQLLHRWERDQVLPDGHSPHPRPVLYNSWYSTYFDVNEALLKKVAEIAATLGVELFAIDDGWFGRRNNDRAGLGDWEPNPEKFPNGLGPVIEHVHKLGMKFGIWIEPEMVNPDSDLYRAHADWVIHFPGRPRSEQRNQLVLNLARNDVKEHLFGVLDKLLSENRIDYVKWDMNREFTEPGWPEVPIERQKTIWIEYVRNLYDLWDRLRERHPEVIFEACSGGGGRIDLAMLSRSEQVWTSDNTDPFDRLKIQHGFTLAYPPKAMMAWVTDVPDRLNQRTTSLQFRFLSAMMGSLGISVALEKWPEEDLAFARKMIALYKDIRETIQRGDLYRLASPWEGDLTANQYVSADGKQAVVFAFRHSQQFRDTFPPLRLRGLDPATLYRLRPIDEKVTGDSRTVSGAFLMNHGLLLRLVGDYDATAVVLEKLGSP